ncbi:MAG: hypothetical protein QOJ89_3398, partial [bacterium]
MSPRSPAAEAELDRAIALARALLHGAGALRVKVALDAAEPALVECERLRAIVVHDSDGAARELPHDAAGDVELPPLPFMHQLPPFEIDAAEGRVAGALRVKIALDAAEPALVDCARLRAIVVHDSDGAAR